MSKLTLEIKAKKNNKPTIFELKGESIKPCPFCGSCCIYIDEFMEFFQVKCSTCSAGSPIRDNRKDAINKWQRRRIVLAE